MRRGSSCILRVVIGPRAREPHLACQLVSRPAASHFVCACIHFFESTNPISDTGSWTPRYSETANHSSLVPGSRPTDTVKGLVPDGSMLINQEKAARPIPTRRANLGVADERAGGSMREKNQGCLQERRLAAAFGLFAADEDRVALASFVGASHRKRCRPVGVPIYCHAPELQDDRHRFLLGDGPHPVLLRKEVEVSPRLSRSKISVREDSTNRSVQWPGLGAQRPMALMERKR